MLSCLNIYTNIPSGFLLDSLTVPSTHLRVRTVKMVVEMMKSTNVPNTGRRNAASDSALIYVLGFVSIDFISMTAHAVKY